MYSYTCAAVSKNCQISTKSKQDSIISYAAQLSIIACLHFSILLNSASFITSSMLTITEVFQPYLLSAVSVRFAIMELTNLQNSLGKVSSSEFARILNDMVTRFVNAGILAPRNLSLVSF